MLRRVLSPLTLLLLPLAACADRSDPTELAAPGLQAPAPRLSVSTAAFTINSGSCSYTGGVFRCSYNVANPGGHYLYIYPEGEFRVAYDCIGKSGRVLKSGTFDGWASIRIEGSATSYTGTDVTVSPLPSPPSGLTGSSKKDNACKGQAEVAVTGSTLLSWDIWVETHGEDPAYNACLGTSPGCGT